MQGLKTSSAIFVLSSLKVLNIICHTAGNSYALSAMQYALFPAAAATLC